MPKHISIEKEKEIVAFYKSRPMTISEVAKNFNVCSLSIIKILNKYRIKRYSKSKLFSPNLREDYFEIIDTHEKAYFLGLILTDGCVYSKNGKQPIFTLTLHEKDAYLIEALLKELNSNKKVTQDGRGCCEVSISSKKLVSDLRKYGVVERKSLIATFPDNIEIEYYSSLLRGIIDGDGSISYYARKNRKSHIKAVRLCSGNEKFLLDIVDFLYKNLNVAPIKTYQEKDNLWSIAYRKNASMISIIDYIYKDATIYMKRKKELCDLVYAECVKYADGNTEITI